MKPRCPRFWCNIQLNLAYGSYIQENLVSRRYDFIYMAKLYGALHYFMLMNYLFDIRILI